MTRCLSCGLVVVLWVAVGLNAAWCGENPARTKGADQAFQHPVLDRLPLSAEVKAKLVDLYKKYQKTQSEVVAWGVAEYKKTSKVPADYSAKLRKNEEEFQAALFAELDAKQKELYEKGMALFHELQVKAQPLMLKMQKASEKEKAELTEKIKKMSEEFQAKLEGLFTKPPEGEKKDEKKAEGKAGTGLENDGGGCGGCSDCNDCGGACGGCD